LARPPSIEDLDKALSDLQKVEATAQVAVSHNIDVDAGGNLPPTLPTPDRNVPLEVRKKSATNALQNYSNLADRVQLMLESTIDVAVDRRKLNPDLGQGRRDLGPEGGPGGLAFSIDTADETFEIERIKVWSSDVVDAIQVGYRYPTDPAIVIEGSKYGGGGGSLYEIQLSRGEFIMRVTGTVGIVVDSIVFHTNLRTLPQRGGNGGERGFDYRCDQGEKVIGFHGRFGAHVDALGVTIRPRR
jgi:hypothetical protein